MVLQLRRQSVDLERKKNKKSSKEEMYQLNEDDMLYYIQLYLY